MFHDLALDENGLFTIRSARLYCLRRGIRTLGAEFWGGGDSGSLEGLVLGDGFSLPLAEALDKDGSPRSWVGIYQAKASTPLPDTGVLTEHEQVKQLFFENPHGLKEAIKQLLNKILDKYSYDWYNNDGGGGAIAVDLLTLEYQIDGYYNETVQNDAPESGSLLLSEDYVASEDDFAEIAEVGLLLPHLNGLAGIPQELTLADLISQELGDGVSD